MKLPYDASMYDVDQAIRFLQREKPGRFATSVKSYKDALTNNVTMAVSFKDRDNRYPTMFFRAIISDKADMPLTADMYDSNQDFIDLFNKICEELWPSVNIVDEWDTRMLRLAAGELNTWSKDPSTKVSAAVFRGKYPIAMSYNGFPPGIADTEERLQNRELKYKLVQHAEANAIATCAKLGIATEGCTMSVTHHPCSTCAGQIIAAGIKKVIVKKPTPDFLSRWTEQVNLAQEMFSEAGVELVIIDLDET